MNLSYTIRDEIRGKGLGDLYLGDWRTELFLGGGGEYVFGIYAKMAEVGNGAVR